MTRGVPEEYLTVNRTFKIDGEHGWGHEINGDAAFPPVIFNAIAEGYGCGECYLYFEGIWRPVCPACGTRTSEFKPVPQWWTGYSVI